MYNLSGVNIAESREERYHSNMSYRHMYFDPIAIGLTIDYFTYENAGYIKKWEMCFCNVDNSTKIIKGKNQQDFIDLLKRIITTFGLKSNVKLNENTGKSYGTMDSIVIYVRDNKQYNAVKGFFKDYITNDIDITMDLLEFFNIRMVDSWIANTNEIKKQLNIVGSDAYLIAKYTRNLIDKVFIGERFHITPNMRLRWKLRQIRTNEELDIAAKCAPLTRTLYTSHRKALYSGLFYAKSINNNIIEDNIISVDRKSAYIYEMLFRKFNTDTFRVDKIENWEKYYNDINNGKIYSRNRVSIGFYRIVYKPNKELSRIIRIYDKKFKFSRRTKDEEITTNLMLVDIDLWIINQIVTVVDIECLSLHSAPLGSLPKYLRQTLYSQFISKENAKNNKFSYTIEKTVLNGIVGDCVRKILPPNPYPNHTEEHYNYIKNVISAKYSNYKHSEPLVNEYWGILDWAYARYDIFTLGQYIDDWYYSDTDSIFCKDTDYNRKRIALHNKQLIKDMKKYVNNEDIIDFDYDMLKGIGTYTDLKYINKIKVFNCKQYAYVVNNTIEGDEYIIKASGCNKDDLSRIGEDIYDKDYIPVGNRVLPRYNPNTTSCVIKGVEYTSYGSYWENVSNSERRSDDRDYSEHLIKASFRKKYRPTTK